MKITGIALICILFACNLTTDEKQETSYNDKESYSSPIVNINDSIKIVVRSDKTFYQTGDSIKYAIEVIGANPDSGQLIVDGHLISVDANGIYHWESMEKVLSGEYWNKITWTDKDRVILSELISKVYILPPLGYISSEYGDILYKGVENKITGFCVEYNHAGLVGRAKGGTIKKSGSNEYLVKPDDTSEVVQISIRCKVPTKISENFEVRDLPNPSLSLSENGDKIRLDAIVNLPSQRQLKCEIIELTGIEIENRQIEEISFKEPPIEIDKSREIYFSEMRCKCPGIDSAQVIKLGMKYDQ